MLLQVKKRSLDKIEGKIEASWISHKLPIRTIIRIGIMPPITLNFLRQQHSYSLGDLRIGNC